MHFLQESQILQTVTMPNFLRLLFFQICICSYEIFNEKCDSIFSTQSQKKIRQKFCSEIL